MKYFPNDDYEIEEMKGLGIEDKNDWRIQALKMNPDYNSWGNDEDYMLNGSGWSKSIEIDSVDELFKLDELNELVNFYFNVIRQSKTCSDCDGTGYNDRTKEIYKSWYDDKTYLNLSQEEVDALWENDRLKFDFKDKPTAKEVNEKASKTILYHDMINHYICTEAKAKSLGVYGKCKECGGKGFIYTEDEPKLSLQMWFIHPRKGASRGVLLKTVRKNELPKVIEYLKEANKRNNERFSKL